MYAYMFIHVHVLYILLSDLVQPPTPPTWLVTCARCMPLAMARSDASRYPIRTMSCRCSTAVQQQGKTRDVRRGAVAARRAEHRVGWVGAIGVNGRCRITAAPQTTNPSHLPTGQGPCPLHHAHHTHLRNTALLARQCCVRPCIERARRVPPPPMQRVLGMRHCAPDLTTWSWQEHMRQMPNAILGGAAWHPAGDLPASQAQGVPTSGGITCSLMQMAITISCKSQSPPPKPGQTCRWPATRPAPPPPPPTAYCWSRASTNEQSPAQAPAPPPLSPEP